MVKRASLGRCLGARSSIMGSGEVWTLHCVGYIEERWGLGGVGVAAPGLGWGGGSLPSSQLLTPPWYCPTYVQWQGVVRGGASSPHLRHPTQPMLWFR